MSFTPLPVEQPIVAHEVQARIERGLRLITVTFPYLSGLAAAARVTLDERVPTMGVFASGRLVANPRFVARLKENDLQFVLAHEMLHLALRTHDRSRGSARLEFNYAHDYIINDILREALGVTNIPAGGLDMPGARERSAEDIVLDMRRNAQSQTKTSVWEGESTTVRRKFGGGNGTPRRVAGGQPGAGGPKPDDDGDVLDESTEREMFPDEADNAAREAEATRERAAKALALARAMGALANVRGFEPGGQSQMVDALRGMYRTPWEMALQRWLESVAPGERTFTRASRRGAERTDVVMPGRRREGWILNVVLDTSGSMTEILGRALGAIADFCDAVGVEQVRVVQCDAQVTADDLLTPYELARRPLSGFGGSDLTPALEYLAADPQVRAVLVLTDGDIEYPREIPPFDVLWVVTPGFMPTQFAPPYGKVLRLTNSN